MYAKFLSFSSKKMDRGVPVNLNVEKNKRSHFSPKNVIKLTIINF